jgi:methionyl aminopeptidase
MTKLPKLPLVHDAAAFEGMRKAGRVAASILDAIEPFVKEGISTGELNDLCHQFICQQGAIPAPLNYRGFPKSICTSINHVVCHGIPGPRRLAKGDILNIDVTVIVDGWHGDTSRMFVVPPIPARTQHLIAVTYEAMMRGIKTVAPGAHLGDIGFAIQSYVEAEGFSVVRDFCGHGIGRVFHDEPEVLHVGTPGQGILLKEGYFFTIEPMVNMGHYGVKILPDGWTAVTMDRRASAQFEHTIGVTKHGCEIFTQSDQWKGPNPHLI